MEEYFISSGVIRYFLPDIPLWANFSQSGKCMRRKTQRYFDMKAVKSSFSMNYEEFIQLQLLYNKEVDRLLRETKAKTIPFKIEEKTFFQVSDQVQAGVKLFKSPKFKRVHAVWIDEAFQSRRGLNKLKKLMKKESFQKGHPIFLSLCLSHDELENFVAKNKMEERNIRLISSEMFSPYDARGVQRPYFSLNLSKILKRKQKIHLFVPKGRLPVEFKGDFIIHSI